MKRTHLILFLGGVLVGALVALVITWEPAAPKATAQIAPGRTASTHAHATVEVDRALPVPAATLTAVADTVSGLNLHITTTDFSFTPELVNAPPRPNQGHAHLFVNGVKVARVYGEWYHLAANHLAPGENAIEVTLNANDHAEWVRDGQHIGARVTVMR